MLTEKFKVKSIVHLYELLPENERLMVDVIRNIIIDVLPGRCKEKISFNVPYFYGNKGICIVWPASIKGGGITRGVLFGLWRGNELQDHTQYLTKGKNKKIFYKIFYSLEDIDESQIKSILTEAILLDSKIQ
ncbi:MAG TPA: DUF1801 domain-containing protein [Saprospiraceae bacterium]|nr:DUF1801 domain-containing protein [Saprospiraceae bacterium]